MSRSARERLLEAASDLFYHEGIAATGIDRVIERAGVAKASLYNNFAGKDDLVAAYLAAALARVEERLAALGHADPGHATLAFFDDLVDRAAQPGFVGCPFLNAAVELAPDAPARRVVAAFAERLAAFFVADLGGRPELGDRLALCYWGAMAARRVSPRADAVREAARLARALVDEVAAESLAPPATPGAPVR
ncbi:MAG: TetR/AcrR family transcriptional regulator [Acidimicrobiales bacterium]